MARTVKLVASVSRSQRRIIGIKVNIVEEPGRKPNLQESINFNIYYLRPLLRIMPPTILDKVDVGLTGANPC